MIHDCNDCGLCKAVCPVYKVLLKESASPRGIIRLANKDIKDIVFFYCANCKACENICPCNVKIDIEKIRQQLIREGIETKEAKEIVEKIKDCGNPYGIDE